MLEPKPGQKFIQIKDTISKTFCLNWDKFLVKRVQNGDPKGMSKQP